VNYVLAFYIFDLGLVSLGIMIYFRNKRLEDTARTRA